jgi:LysM repeat protein
LATLLLLFVLAAQGLRALLHHQPPASAIDLIIGQERQAKLPLINRDLARDRLEVSPRPSATHPHVQPRVAARAPRQQPSATVSQAPLPPSARARAASPHPTFRPYRLRRGDTLRSIAAGTHLTEHTIAQVNHLSPRLRRLKPGGLVYLPHGNGVLHPVQPHESLVDLSIRYHVGLARLRAANPHLHGLRLRPASVSSSLGRGG